MTMLKFFSKPPLFILLGALLACQLPAVADTSGVSSSISKAVQAATVNINSASAEELADTLIGVGLKRAEAIVAYRNTNGSFTSVDQLLEIKGIGAKLLSKNRHLIALK